MGIRFSLENLAIAIFLAGGVAALIFHELSMETALSVSVGVVMTGIAVWGLDMIVKRKAEIATRYSDSTIPSFHVFRGVPAIAWGVTVIVFVGLIVGYNVIELTGWTSARTFFGERPGIVIALVGVMMTAWGVANAGKATYRRRKEERPVSRLGRLGDRITGVLLIPVGLCVTAMGVLYLVAPAAAAALREAGRAWGLSLIYRLKDYLESSRM